MPRHFKNRSAKEWRAISEAFKLEKLNDKGDDEIWGKQDKPGIVIFIPSRDSSTIILQTAYHMLSRLGKLGVSKKDVKRWWKENGYGD